MIVNKFAGKMVSFYIIINQNDPIYFHPFYERKVTHLNANSSHHHSVPFQNAFFMLRFYYSFNLQ